MSSVDNETNQKRIRVFRDALEVVEEDYSRNTVGYIFGVGSNARFEIDRKVRDTDMKSARAPTRTDVLAIQLLERMKKDGYQLDQFVFHDDGELVRAPNPKLTG